MKRKVVNKKQIYVPAEIKSRMDARDDVNWSLVAQAAFKKFLDADDKQKPFVQTGVFHFAGTPPG